MSGSELYPDGVQCPHCGVGVGDMCEFTDSDGRTGIIRPNPHDERIELARELHADN